MPYPYTYPLSLPFLIDAADEQAKMLRSLITETAHDASLETHEIYKNQLTLLESAIEKVRAWVRNPSETTNVRIVHTVSKNRVVPGTRLIADGGFTCLKEGDIVTVLKTHNTGELCVLCEEGLHALAGQLDKHDCYIGFLEVMPEQPTVESSVITCDCGAFTGNLNKGKYCTLCNTVCRPK